MHFKIFKMIATRGFLTAVECKKNPFSAAGGAHDAPPDPLVGWGGDTPPHSHPLDAFGVSVSSPASTRPRRLRRLVPKTPSEIFFLDTALVYIGLSRPSFSWTCWHSIMSSRTKHWDPLHSGILLVPVITHSSCNFSQTVAVYSNYYLTSVMIVATDGN